MSAPTNRIIPIHARRRSTCAALALALIGGCTTPSKDSVHAPTQADRLMQFYPELRSGRFALIADFEDPVQADLFELQCSTSEASIQVGSDFGRRETGRNGLEFTAASPGDALSITNRTDARWFLKRDWLPYDLLLLSLKAPQSEIEVELALSSGPSDQRVSAHSTFSLSKGWNVLRVDLMEVGERIALDDVREVRISLAGASKAARIQLDDVILAGHRVDLLGNSKNPTGGLYVQQAGRRWNIGAGGAFELTFSNGQIVRWFNLRNDPNRLFNLVQGTALGPTPVIFDETGTGLSDFAPLGSSVAAQQRIVEVNAVRVVIESEWRFLIRADGPATNRPFQRWRYTIYATGQVFVRVEATSRTPTWVPSRIGLAVSVASRGNAKAVPIPAWSSPTTSTDNQAEALQVAAEGFRLESSDGFLLFAVRTSGGTSAENMTVVRSSEKTESLVAPVEVGNRDVIGWSAHLFLGSELERAASEIVGRVREFGDAPATIRTEVGAPAARPGLRADGFDPDQGCFHLEPSGGRLRFVLEGGKRPIHSPVFQVTASGYPSAWVYVNHRVFEPIARLGGGDLVFQLPGEIRDFTSVEVILTRGATVP